MNLRPARESDASAVAELVDAAYGHYVERLGEPPGPMTWDYLDIIRSRRVIVAEDGRELVGVIVFGPAEEGFLIDNVAVHPSRRGMGLGRTLLRLAETAARREGWDSVYLYTHEKMTENLALYARIGYLEFARRPVGDFSLVFLRKRLV